VPKLAPGPASVGNAASGFGVLNSVAASTTLKTTAGDCVPLTPCSVACSPDADEQ